VEAASVVPPEGPAVPLVEDDVVSLVTVAVDPDVDEVEVPLVVDVVDAEVLDDADVPVPVDAVVPIVVPLEDPSGSWLSGLKHPPMLSAMPTMAPCVLLRPR